MAKAISVSAQANPLSTEVASPNHTVVALPAYKRQANKAAAFFWSSFSSVIVGTLGSMFGGALMIDAVAAGPFLLAGGGVSLLTAIACGKAYSISVKPVDAAVWDERANLKKMLLVNFGRNSGITEDIVTNCVMKNYQWTHNDEIFTVEFDDASGEYSFSRQDFFGGELTEVSNAFLVELKPFMLKLKAADFPGESTHLVKELVSTVSRLVQSDLDAEQKHEVKRLVVDAGELLRISSDLAVFDEVAAETKLVEGLRALSADATILATEKRESISRQLDSYNSYVGTRSLTA